MSESAKTESQDNVMTMTHALLNYLALGIAIKVDGRAKTSGGDFEVRRIIRQVLRDHGGRLFEWWHDVFRGINKAPD